MAERHAKTPRIQAQTTAIAWAMARICNDETGCLGVQAGHGGKTLRLSGLPSSQTFGETPFDRAGCCARMALKS